MMGRPAGEGSFRVAGHVQSPAVGVAVVFVGDFSCPGMLQPGEPEARRSHILGRRRLERYVHDFLSLAHGIRRRRRSSTARMVGGDVVVKVPTFPKHSQAQRFHLFRRSTSPSFPSTSPAMGRKRGREGVEDAGSDDTPSSSPPRSLSPTMPPGSEPQHSGIQVSKAWSDVANKLALHTETPPVVFICGPKNSGKSTFSRYLVNTLLPRFRNVAYLDTDVGQPEFTPPGILSLHVLQEHIADLKIMTLKTPVMSLFFGDVSPKRDPRLCLNGIFSLYNYFLKEYCETSDLTNIITPILPLVINTAGWVKGTGYEQLVEMLRYIKPTHMVQIRIAQSKNLPRGFFWLDENQEVTTSLSEINAAQKNSGGEFVPTQKPSRELRDLRIVGYFRQCVPCDMDVSTYKKLAYTLASIPPYEVPISTIKIRHLHCQVASSETFHSLNASIVGLAVSDEVTENGMPWCVGLGIVRGIDISNDLLYVITPVCPSILEKVDLFIQGFVEIPTSLLQIQGFMSPYISANVLNKLDSSNMKMSKLS